MLKFLIVSFFLFGTSMAFHRQCHEGANYPVPNRVTSPSCTATRCSIGRGETLIGEVWFTPTADHQRIDAFSRALYGGAWIDLPIDPPHNDACHDLFDTSGNFVGCPTTPGVEKVWQLNFQADAPFALMDTIVEFMLVDMDRLQVISCFEVDADIL